jgi:glycosyl transferase family 25
VHVTKPFLCETLFTLLDTIILKDIFEAEMMGFPEELDCLLINLDRSPERLRKMQKKLSEMEVPFCRVSAVDGKTMVFTDSEINVAEYEKCHGKRITPTEVACNISHYNALKTFVAGNKNFALILEDDVDFCANFKPILEELLTLREDWDFVKLNGTPSWAFPVTFKKLASNYRLVVNWMHQGKAGAYLVNRRAAERLIEGLLPMKVPFDHEFIKFWKYDIRLFSVNPFPAWEKGEPSTIDYEEMRKNIKPWYKRGTTLLYRTKILVQRFYYAALLSNGSGQRRLSRNDFFVNK